MQIDRRALLIGGSAVAAGLAVGAVGGRLGWWDVDILGLGNPDDALLRVARRAEAALIRAYDIVAEDPTTANATLGSRLAAYRQHHVDHLVALGGGQRDIDDAPAPGQAGPEQPAGAPPPVPALPEDSAMLPGYFAQLEQRHADLVATGARIAQRGDVARLMALILAGESANTAGWTDA